MFSFFKKSHKKIQEEEPSFEIELTAAVLAYEIARIDGDISSDELKILMEEIKIIAKKVGKGESEILKIIEIYSNDSVSFYEFVEDINNHFTKEQKLALIKLLYETAYADNILEVNEERLIRRIAELIRIKSSLVLKVKEEVRSS